MHNKFSYLVDSHCHLDLIEEKGIALSEILTNCQNNNVKILQNICTRFSNLDKILSYTINHPNIYASAGLHPCYVSTQEYKNYHEIVTLCNHHPRIIGIGETGLDYFHDTSLIHLQKKSFIEHINASQETQLPLIIHARNADEDMADILQSTQKHLNYPALLHCFSSSPQLARCALELGMYISVAGIVTFKNASELQEIIQKIPLENLLIETDSPYLAPTPHRGKVNQPAYCLHVAEFIATIKKVSVEEVTTKTTENFHKIFKRAKLISE